MGKLAKDKRGSKKTKAAKPKVHNYTSAQYISKAEDSLTSFEPEMAEKFLRKALEVAPTSTDAMDLLAETLTEMGRVDEARDLLVKSIQLAPDQGHTKYLCLGQMCEYPHSVQFLQRGIELLTKDKAAHEARNAPKDEMDALASKLASAHCSIAEIFMSDACDEPEAEQQAEHYAQLAVAAQSNVESHMVLANVRLCQSRPDEARTQAAAAAAALAVVVDSGAIKQKKPKQPANNNNDNIDDDDDDDDDDDAADITAAIERSANANIPSLGALKSLAKLLIECELFEDAHDVIDLLLAEEEDNSEFWFLSGFVCDGQGNVQAARECLIHSKELAEKNKEGDDIIQIIQAKLDEVMAKPCDANNDVDDADKVDDGSTSESDVDNDGDQNMD